MLRLAAYLCLLTLTASACSRDSERTVASTPTAPTALAITAGEPTGLGGVSGPAAVSFPARNEALEFRSQLETKYQVGLNRGTSSSAVDREGEVVWLGELRPLPRQWLRSWHRRSTGHRPDRRCRRRSGVWRGAVWRDRLPVAQ